MAKEPWEPPNDYAHPLPADPAAPCKAMTVRDVLGPTFPPIVCLCGSTRFMDAFFEAGWKETLAGKIVLSVGVCKYADAGGAHGAEVLGPDTVQRLDDLHLRKIELADEVLVLNVGGYIGPSTGNELAYALALGKPVRTLEALDLEAWKKDRDAGLRREA